MTPLQSFFIVAPSNFKVTSGGGIFTETSEPSLFDQVPGHEDILSLSCISALASGSSSRELSSSAYKTVVSQVNGLNKHPGQLVPVVVGCQIRYVRYTCQIVTVPITMARIPNGSSGSFEEIGMRSRVREKGQILSI